MTPPHLVGARMLNVQQQQYTQELMTHAVPCTLVPDCFVFLCQKIKHFNSQQLNFILVEIRFIEADLGGVP